MFIIKCQWHCSQCKPKSQIWLIHIETLTLVFSPSLFLKTRPFNLVRRSNLATGCTGYQRSTHTLSRMQSSSNGSISDGWRMQHQPLVSCIPHPLCQSSRTCLFLLLKDVPLARPVGDACIGRVGESLGWRSAKHRHVATKEGDNSDRCHHCIYNLYWKLWIMIVVAFTQKVIYLWSADCNLNMTQLQGLF